MAPEVAGAPEEPKSINQSIALGRNTPSLIITVKKYFCLKKRHCHNEHTHTHSMFRMHVCCLYACTYVLYTTI